MSRVYQLTPGQLLAALDRAVGTGEEPDGLCADRSEHRAHLHDSESLGRFWCTADQSQREPGRSQRRLDATPSGTVPRRSIGLIPHTGMGHGSDPASRNQR